MGVTYCYWLAAIASCVQASRRDLDRFVKRQAGESGWSAYVVDWRDWYESAAVPGLREKYNCTQ
jgi:hypothetical protein